MTNKEAAEELRYLKHNVGEGSNKDKALDMAITALSAKNINEQINYMSALNAGANYHDAISALVMTMRKGDTISRQWCLNEYDRRHQGPPGGARKIIEEAPSVSMGIIRCKNCEHRKSSLYCEAWNNSPGFPCIPDDGYCWLYERRSND